MKKALLFVLSAATIFSACKKETTTTVATSTLYIPHNLDSLLPTVNLVVSRPRLNNVIGVFTACRTSGELVDTSSTPYHYRRNWQNAMLYDSVYHVSVNGHMLAPVLFREVGDTKAWLNSYDDGSVWNDVATNNWNIVGAASPSFTVDVDGSLPLFTGTLPDTISSSSDFTYAFNSSNCSNADSAYFIIYTGGYYAQSACVNAHSGIATVPASSLHSSSISLTGGLTSIDGDIFSGRPMAVVLFSHTFQTIAGKRYAFVKQKVQLKMVKVI